MFDELLDFCFIISRDVKFSWLWMKSLFLMVLRSWSITQIYFQTEQRILNHPIVKSFRSSIVEKGKSSGEKVLLECIKENLGSLHIKRQESDKFVDGNKVTREWQCWYPRNGVKRASRLYCIIQATFRAPWLWSLPFINVLYTPKLGKGMCQPGTPEILICWLALHMTCLSLVGSSKSERKLNKLHLNFNQWRIMYWIFLLYW